MNLTLSYLYLSNRVGSCVPLLDDRSERLNIHKSRFSHFVSPLSYTRPFLSIEKSSFSFFVAQVLRSEDRIKHVLFEQLQDVKLSCISFSDIHTEKQGSIFSISSSFVEISQCSFVRVSSLSNPGCFYLYKSTVNVKQCTFEECRGIGYENEGFGNAYYCENCHNTHSYVSTTRCSNETSYTADSTIVFLNSDKISVSNFNASYNLGINGSSSFGIWYTDFLQDSVRFGTVVGPNNLDAIEILWLNSAYLKDFNFINTTECQSCVHNQECRELTCENCVFINPCSAILRTTTGVTLTSCFANVENDYENCNHVSGLEVILFDLFTIKCSSKEKINERKQYSIRLDALISVFFCINHESITT